jgi:hypothetical protein
MTTDTQASPRDFVCHGGTRRRPASHGHTPPPGPNPQATDIRPLLPGHEHTPLDRHPKKREPHPTPHPTPTPTPTPTKTDDSAPHRAKISPSAHGGSSPLRAPPAKGAWDHLRHGHQPKGPYRVNSPRRPRAQQQHPHHPHPHNPPTQANPPQPQPRPPETKSNPAPNHPRPGHTALTDDSEHPEERTRDHHTDRHQQPPGHPTTTNQPTRTPTTNQPPTPTHQHPTHPAP